MTTQAKVEAGTIKLVLMAKEDIKRDQDGIRKSLLNLDGQIHANAVQCLMHAEKHGDTSLMRRLLIEIVDAKTGYRRQGLINWMRKHSPMELKGDVINLSGTDNKGNKRPFLVEDANNTPFWNDTANAERVARPVFQETVVSKVDAAIRDFERAMANTVNGKPIDETKPYYSGLHTDKVVSIFAAMKELRETLPADDTAKVVKARMQREELDNFINSADAAPAPETEADAERLQATG